MDSSSSPSIALAIPTYNREYFLQMLLDSVPRDLPCHVSDNAGCLRQSPLQQVEGVRIYSLDSLIPAYSNWIRAASLVQEDYFAITSDDDMYAPGGIDTVRRYIAAHPGFDIYVFGHDVIDEFNNRRAGYVPGRLELLEAPHGFRNFVHGVDARTPSVFFRRAFFEQVGGFDTAFQLTAGDSELIQRILLLGRSVYVPEVVSYYRVWRGSSTQMSQATDEWMREVRVWVEKIAALLQSAPARAALDGEALPFGDEIVARNLWSGLRGMLRRGEYRAARDFLARQGIPPRARWAMRLRLALCRAWLNLRVRA